MISFELLKILFSWVDNYFEFSFFTIVYPEPEELNPFEMHFRDDSLFCLGYYGGELYLELFFFVLIGEKHYE